MTDDDQRQKVLRAVHTARELERKGGGVFEKSYHAHQAKDSPEMYALECATKYSRGGAGNTSGTETATKRRGFRPHRGQKAAPTHQAGDGKKRGDEVITQAHTQSSRTSKRAGGSRTQRKRLKRQLAATSSRRFFDKVYPIRSPKRCPCRGEPPEEERQCVASPRMLLKAPEGGRRSARQQRRAQLANV